MDCQSDRPRLPRQEERLGSREPLASEKHTVIMLAIVLVVALLGLQQARAASVAATGSESRVWTYVSLIGLQLLWVRFVHVGIKNRGHSLADLMGRCWSPRSGAIDLLVAGLGFFVARSLADGIRVLSSGAQVNTAFLLPRTVPEAVAWVLLSVTAGVCEEIVFRGYLQRQLAVLSGSVLVGIAGQAAAFGLSHGYQGAVSIATTGSYGLTLGALAWWRGNVRATALAHAATDLIGGLFGAHSGWGDRADGAPPRLASNHILNGGLRWGRGRTQLAPKLIRQSPGPKLQSRGTEFDAVL